MAFKLLSHVENLPSEDSAALLVLRRTCMQDFDYVGQNAHLMAGSLDESGLAAARRTSAEVEEPRGWALQHRP